VGLCRPHDLHSLLAQARERSVVVTAPASLPLPRIRTLPQHVAVIMDGNGRWAEARGLSRQDGHRAGAENLRTVIERFGEHGVPVLTLFAFSTENWGRPRSEVDGIMRLASRLIDRELSTFREAGVRLRHLGELDALPKTLQRKIQHAVTRTAENERMTVNLAFNYGGRADIVAAVRQLVAEGVAGDAITEDAIAARLCTADLPEPDLLIRTGGEHRISNFLVWQAAYCEYHFTNTHWPDFGAAEVDVALLEYSRRRRRFGLVPDGDAADG
jgi:undecaprenyl diphosphate synthase